MTTQYTMDVTHSTLLNSAENRMLVSDIKGLILNDVGLANLNKEITDKRTIDAILERLALIMPRPGAWSKYLFNPRTSEHVFLLHSSRSDKVPEKVTDMIACIPKDRTSIRYYLDEKLFLLRVNSRFYPLSGTTKITATPAVMNYVFNGPVFIRRVNKDRFIDDSRDVWSMNVAEINSSIDNMVEVINQDIKRFWNKSKFTPPDALFIADNLLENVHTLMVLMSTNYNIPKFETTRYGENLVLEVLDVAYSKYSKDKHALDFTYVAIFAVGKLLERLVSTDYQHLLKGFLSCNKKLKSA